MTQKFKAWDKKNKKWVGKDFLEYLCVGADETIVLVRYAPNNSGGYSPILIRQLINPEVEDLEIVQFTGLKDNAGKEIYAGDILHIWSYYTNGKRTYDDGNWEVYWRNDRWHLKRGKEGYDNGDYYEGDECPWPTVNNWEPSENGSRIEVIGNIHENPELIT